MDGAYRSIGQYHQSVIVSKSEFAALHKGALTETDLEAHGYKSGKATMTLRSEDVACD